MVDKGEFLFVRDDGTKSYELDYARYKIKNNPELKEDRYITAIANNNKKVMDSIPLRIWNTAYKQELNIDLDSYKYKDDKKEGVQLIGIGRFQSKPAKDIVIGKDYLVWNFGYTSKPLRILKTTPKQIVFQTMTKDGGLYTRRLAKNRQVAFTTENQGY